MDNKKNRTFGQIAETYEYFGDGGFFNPDSRDLEGDALLHKASHLGREQDVFDLIALGCDVDALGDCSNTPLHYAAMGGHAGVARILIGAGANTGFFNKFGYTPGGFAEFFGYIDVAKLIGNASSR